MAEDRVLKILRRLPTWWNTEVDSTTFQLIESFVAEFDELTGEIDNLSLEIFVDTATGVRLDSLGAIFRITRREGETDDALRARIKSFFPTHTQGGTKDAIEAAVADVLGIDVSNVTVTDFPDLKIDIDIVVDAVVLAEKSVAVHNVVDSVKAAGIWPKFQWNVAFVEDDLEVADASNLEEQIDTDFFIIEESLLDGPDQIEGLA